MEVWPGWSLTGNHPAAKDGVPVLVSPTGRAYKPEDIEPREFSQSDLAKSLGVSSAAVRDRISRGTLPAYDGFKPSGRGYWTSHTIRAILSKDRS